MEDFRRESDDKLSSISTNINSRCLLQSADVIVNAFDGAIVFVNGLMPSRGAAEKAHQALIRPKKLFWS